MEYYDIFDGLDTRERYKFQGVSTSLIICFSLSIVMIFINAYIYSSISNTAIITFLTLFMAFSSFITIAINGFAIIVCLLKKRGAILIIVVCTLAIWPLISEFISFLLQIIGTQNISTQSIVVFFLSQCFRQIPFLLLIGLAIYCNRNKGTPIRGLSKLWFLPGILSIVMVVLQLVPYIQYSHLFPDENIITIIMLSGLLMVVTIFLLGRWISYINSLPFLPLAV